MKLATIILLLASRASAEFSQEAQNAILDVHNNLRSSIAQGKYEAQGVTEPPATDMLKLSWDESIAVSAQNYANTCPTGHSGDSGVGENIFWSWGSGSIEPLDQYAPIAADSWQQEFQENGWISRILDIATFNTGIGHATQMVWAATSQLGCGVKDCGPDPSMNNWNQLVVVCQYKKQGNVLNHHIYTEGETCSACPTGTTCEKASGLCA